jgi:KDO2-lipid IV(A) lauroyltransferase
MAFISKRDLPFMGYAAITLALRLLPKRIRFRSLNLASRYLGELWYRLDRADAALTRRNMQLRLGLPAAQIEACAQGLYRNVAYSKLINDLLPDMQLDDIQQYLRLEGEEHLCRALERGRGAILLTTHFGLHGYSTMALLKHLGFEFAAVVGDEIETGDSWFYAHYILPLRQRAGTRLGIHVLQPTGQPNIEYLETLRQNRLLLVFGDVMETTMLALPAPQVLPAPLLDWEILLKTGAFRLARGTGSPVLPAFLAPRGAGFALVIEPPLELGRANTNASLLDDLTAFTRRFEPYLAQHPELWAHWRHESLLEITVPLRQSERKQPVPLLVDAPWQGRS